MPKVTNLFSNIFNRRQSSLEVDSVPVSEPSEPIITHVEDISVGNGPFTSQSLDRITSSPPLNNYSNSNQALTNPCLVANETSIQQNFVATNNGLAVNNTQGHIIYQFSNVDGLHIGHVINVRNNNSDSESRCKKEKPRTSTIQKMMQSTEPLDLKMIDTISTHLGKGWKDIMRKLHYSEGQIHQAYSDYRVDGLKEVIFQLLLEWSRNDDDATLGNITKILWKSDQRDIVYYMKDSWKELNSGNESTT